MLPRSMNRNSTLLPVEPESIEDLCAALEGEGASKVQGLSEDFWTRNKGKLDTLYKGRTALSFAAEKGNLWIVKTLLGHSAIVNAKDNGGRTALSYAAQQLDEAIIEVLLEGGANPNEADGKKRTPASWMASTDRVGDQSPPKLYGEGFSRASPIDKCLDLLKEHNAKLHQPDGTSRTPLSWAAEKGLVDMVKYLCGRGRIDDPFAPDDDGRSPLAFAAKYQQYSVIATILMYRLNYQDFDKQHRTPLHWLYQKFNDKGGYQQAHSRTKAMNDILTYLGFNSRTVGFAGSQSKKHDDNSLNILNRSVEGGKTILAYAVLNNYEELIDALWSSETGISPNVPNDDDGETALLLALKQATIGEKKFINHPMFREHLENALPVVIKLESAPMLECLLYEFSKDRNEHTRLIGEALWMILDDASKEFVVPLLRRLFELVSDAGGVELMQKLKSQKKRLELALGKRPNAGDLVQVLLENGLDPGIWTRSEDWFERWAAPPECLVKLCRKNKKADRSSIALEFATDEAPEQVLPCGDKGIEAPPWGIRWMMKPPAEQPVVYESTLRKVWIPDDITDFLAQFPHEFDEKWQACCDTTNGHLDKHRRNASLDEKRTDETHVTELTRDTYYLSALRGTLQTQVRRIQNGIEEAFDTQNESFRKLQYQLREYKAIYNEQLDRYENLVNTLLQLEYARHSVQEARRVRRISSITFIYLPLMFVSSLFGMNIDVLKNNPGWYWYLLLAVTTLGANQIIHQYIQEPNDGPWHQRLNAVGLQRKRTVESSA
ncbi:hypothetical protein BJX65DRAFT_283211 [Aspergillus insuetus]